MFHADFVASPCGCFARKFNSLQVESAGKMMNWRHLHDQYNRYALAWNDLYYVGNIAKLILKEGLYDTAKINRSTERLALTTALVVTYARPFTTAKGFVRLPGSVTTVLTSEQRQLHEEMLAMRDKVYAHTDRQYFWATVEISDGEAQAITSSPRAFVFGLTEEIVTELVEVVEALKQEISRRQREFEQQLIE